MIRQAILSIVLFSAATPLLAEETHSPPRFALPQPTLFQPIPAPLNPVRSIGSREDVLDREQTRPVARPEPAAEDSDPLAAAIAVVIAEVTNQNVTAPAKPTFNPRELIAELNVGVCLNTDDITQPVNITVGVDLNIDGTPAPASIKLISYVGLEMDAVHQAFQALGRAILLCGQDGFDLPAEHYDDWKSVEFVLVMIVAQAPP